MLRKISYALVTVSLAIGISSCKSAKTMDETEVPTGTGSTEMTGGDDNTMGDSDSGKAMGLQTIHFKYDSFDIDSEGKQALNTNAEILKSNSTAKVQIEGHCDQRGGIQYNIALGEKRANRVRDALKKLGISADRIATISYGKERLLDTAMDESAFAKNRRANFAITSK
ncbi:MAG: OmpA family protein [Cryobacterium sp.]|nr:OmpA family protein [Oligoflexia bacterium]